MSSSTTSKAFKASVTRAGEPTLTIPDTLLGQNLEVFDFTVSALCSDRLKNPKFAGPANPQTGIARNWCPTGCCMGDVRFQLTPGMSLSGNESQLIQRYGFLEEGILQPGISVRKDETLEVELWAKARHRPVPLRFEIRPSSPRPEPYDAAEIVIDASYWKKYVFPLSIPRDDDEAVFKCLLLEEGTLWIDQVHLRPKGAGLFNEPMLERLASLGMPILRFPGGCLSTNYHWRHGTGPVHRRPVLPDPVFHFASSYDFGTDEYLEFCRANGIRPHVTVNVGSGTPEEAADWAAYCREWYERSGEEPPQAYFQIGNEHYGVHETAHMTGEMYVEALKAFVPPIREAYPNCRIIALGQSHSAGLRRENRNPWLAPVLDKAADHVDVLSLNRYKGQWRDTDLDQQINVVESVPKIQNDLDELIEAIRSRGLRKTVAVTEWNYWLHAIHTDGEDFHEPGDAQHVFYVSGILNMFARLAPDMELANYYHSVQGMALFRRRGTDVEENCVSEVFRLYRPALPGQFVPLEVESPKLGETEPTLDALATKTDDATWLFLANRHPTETASVSLDGFDGAPEATAIAADRPAEPTRKTDDVTVQNGVVHLPALTLCRLRFANPDAIA